MPAVASDVLASVRDELLDAGVAPAQTWTDTTLLRWLVDTMAAAVTLKRDIAPAILQIPLASGTIQSIQASSSSPVQFMAAYFNTASFNSVTPAPLQLLSRQRPSWRAAAAVTDVIEYEADPRSPIIFHCFPPNNGQGNLTCLCGTMPSITSTSSPIVVPDNYRAALVKGVVSKAYGASTRRGDVQKMISHWQLFEAMIIGAKTAQMEVASAVTDKTGVL